MNFYQFDSGPKQTAFAPEWNHIIGEDVISNVDFNEIARIILSKEKQIIKENLMCPKPGSVDGYTNLGPDSLTSRYGSFNLFEWEEEEIQKLFKEVKLKYLEFMSDLTATRPNVMVQCWANVMRKGQQITPHIHDTSPYSFLGGHVTVACDDTDTVYINPANQINEPMELVRPNVSGSITFFPSCIPHYTTKHESETERITIAFDLIVDTHPQWMNDANNGLIPFDDPSKEENLNGN